MHPGCRPIHPGEASVFDRELGGDGASKGRCAVQKRRLCVAGRDYDHEATCLACLVDDRGGGGGGGGAAAQAGAPTPPMPPTHPTRPTHPTQPKLLGCRLCAMAFHGACAALLGCGPVAGQVGGEALTCPHHACGACGRKAAAAGGMLFRCEACPRAFCEDCLPREAAIVGSSARLEARGVRMPPQGCYVRCSARCEASTER